MRETTEEKEVRLKSVIYVEECSPWTKRPDPTTGGGGVAPGGRGGSRALGGVRWAGRKKRMTNSSLVCKMYTPSTDYCSRKLSNSAEQHLKVKQYLRYPTITLRRGCIGGCTVIKTSGGNVSCNIFVATRKVTFSSSSSDAKDNAQRISQHSFLI